MIAAYIREQKRYSQQELRDIFQCSEDGILAIIRKLKEFGVLKAVKASEKQKDMSDLIDYDIEVVDVELNDNEYFYVFTFVGVIVVAERVLKCYPKYLLSANSPSKELRQVLKVLEKYSNKEQIVRMFNDSNESSAFNLLAIFLFLLHDYYEYGLYNNTNDIIEVNGSGEILWDKTINETFAFLSNGRPVYTELQTRRKINDDYDYFTQLHKCILTRVSEEMKSADLLDLFEYTEVCLSDEELDTFGDDEHILYRIEQELNTQFNTRKQLLLKTIYAYISRKGSFFDMDSLSLFGTNSFNLVWETVCSDVMDNQLQRKLCDLRLPVKLRNNYDAKQKLIDLIEKPLWTATGKTAPDTLIPDLISISGSQFVIFDAKYYNTRLEAGCIPSGQPGIESVTKQYLYQLAYQKFIAEHGFEKVKNCFLMPTEKDHIIKCGEVSLSILSTIGLQDIKVRFLPASMVYNYYLLGKKIDINLLEL